MIHGNNPELKLKEALRAQAYQLGFDAVGFAPARPPPGVEHFSRWLDQGRHGSMVWLEKNSDIRKDPSRLLPGCGVVMVVGLNYRPVRETWAEPNQLDLAAFCRIDDYHLMIKEKLQRLADWLERRCGRTLAGRVCVDSAPVMEKPLAAVAGLGWQGKNTLLVSRQWGGWLFLGDYLIPLDLPPDSPSGSHCGTCRRCCDICPTRALDGLGGMDASRCISYWTLEAKGPIPWEYRVHVGNRVLGCDLCLRVCPWNRFARPARENALIPREDLGNRPLTDFAALTEGEFKELFHRSSAKRVGRTRFLRNLAIALGNSGAGEAVLALARLATEPEVLIRGAAIWGLGRALQPSWSREAQERAGLILARSAWEERHPMVLEEIARARR
ncbi:MAG: tRNA epoxyqueuosine(34) reductase QueG [Magnetococcales bacterium]|nr:tRNA epoxyqueuosine(34) reductase QueG [Magnetococcales bacterium]